MLVRGEGGGRLSYGKKIYIKWDTRYITENLEKSGASDSILGSGVNKIHDPGTMHVAKK